MKAFKKLLDKFRRKNKELAYISGWDAGTTLHPIVVNMSDYSESKEKDKAARIEKKPVEVVEEILQPIPQIDLSNIPEKKKIIKNRIRVLKEQLGMLCFDEKKALFYLESREKWNKVKTYFCWKTTTEEAIRKLCDTYKVKKVSFTSYYKNVPNEALDEIEKYLKAVQKVTDYKSELSLIIDDGGKEDRKDPILLAPSPFGNWYFVLGAWDKEVAIVDDLVYKGK